MRLPSLAALFLLPILFASAASSQESGEALRWTQLAALHEGPAAIGLAGPFAGVSNGALLVAGGANFPGGRPWDGHAKVWHDDVYVLEEPDGAWRRTHATLPRPSAYGVSVTWNDALVCIGGGDGERLDAQVFALRWTGEDVEIEMLPPLPGPTAFACGALLGDVVYVMGGLSAPDATRALDRFVALDLARPAEERTWVELEAWPGVERHLAVAGAQGGSLFLFGGIRLGADANGEPERSRPYLTDAYRFTPAAGLVAGRWEVAAALPRPVAAAPSPAVALGSSHLLVLGGDDGSLTGDLRDRHPGFPATIHAYHTITDTWRELGALPTDHGDDPAGDPGAGVWSPVTTTPVWWGERLVLPSGEIRPGVRTPRVLSAEAAPYAPPFGALDSSVLLVYLLAIVALGFFFSRREHSTGDFFLGGRRVPWWAAGISVFGTQLSAITFLAVPAKTYSTDWLYLIQTLGIVVVAPLVVALYLPFYRRLEVTTAYEYLERRFHVSVRLLGACAFLAFQLARVGIVLLLPALALSAVTGLGVTQCILAMGVLCTLYTVLGGIEAVIWSDVLQVFVLLGGALVALAVVVNGVDGGWSSVFDAAREQDKLRLVSLSWDWTGPALGVILLGALFNNLVPYTSDQAVIQRYLTTSDERQAARAVWTGALLAIPASLLFFAVGTALFVFYQSHPAKLDPHGPTDQIFAWFIARELPAGLSGLVIAGIFAAAMSSLDSSLNSLSAVVSTDFYRRFRKGLSERHHLAVARAVTLVFGATGTAAALWLASAPVRSLWDVFLAYVGLFGGTLAGLFALGILVARANAQGAWIGALASFALLTWVQTQTSTSGLLYAGLGMTSCFVVGSLASLAFPPADELRGLTLKTMVPRGSE